MNRKKSVTALIVLAGIINFAPVIGVVSAARIENLYGVDISDASFEILLRHRAVLFGLLGGFMIFAAFKRRLQMTAIIGGFIAMLSFLALYYLGESQPSSLRSIVYADIAGLFFLGAAMALKFSLRGR